MTQYAVKVKKTYRWSSARVGGRTFSKLGETLVNKEDMTPEIRKSPILQVSRVKISRKQKVEPEVQSDEAAQDQEGESEAQGDEAAQDQTGEPEVQSDEAAQDQEGESEAQGDEAAQDQADEVTQIDEAVGQ